MIGKLYLDNILGTHIIQIQTFRTILRVSPLTFDVLKELSSENEKLEEKETS